MRVLDLRGMKTAELLGIKFYYSSFISPRFTASGEKQSINTWKKGSSMCLPSHHFINHSYFKLVITVKFFLRFTNPIKIARASVIPKGQANLFEQCSSSE